MLNDYKKLLRHEMEVNEELIDLVKSCFDEIFQNDSSSAKSHLDDIILNFQEWGCIQHLEYFRTLIKEEKDRLAKWKQEQEAKEKK